MMPCITAAEELFFSFGRQTGHFSQFNYSICPFNHFVPNPFWIPFFNPINKRNISKQLSKII